MSPRITNRALRSAAARRRGYPSAHKKPDPIPIPRNPFWYALLATLGVGGGLAVLAALGALSTVLVLIGLSVFLALAIEPAVTLVMRRGVPRWAAVLALSLTCVILIFGFVVIVLPALSTQMAHLGERAYESATHLPEQHWFQWLSSAVGEWVDMESLLTDAVSFVSNPESLLTIGGGLLRIGSGIVDAVTGTIVITALTVYFTLSLPALTNKAYQLVNHRHRVAVATLGDDLMQSVGRYVGGQLLLAALSAAVTLTLASLLGVSAPVVLALLAFVGSLIPVVGPVIASAATVVVSLTAGPTEAIVAAVVLLVYMQIESYVLTPRVMSKAVAVPGPLVIVAALAGATLGGVLGAFIAVPVAAAGVTVINRVVIPHQQGKQIL